jgi:DNA polymerase type B, organellar and viral
MWRYLRGNLSTEGPRHVFVVDAETSREPDDGDAASSLEILRLGVARYFRQEGSARSNRLTLAFQTASQFWEWLERRACPRSINWVFAHSAGFDLQALGWGVRVDAGFLSLTKPPLRRQAGLPAAQQDKRGTGLIVLDSPPTIIDAWTRSGKHLRFCCTRNWWNRPLAELGQWLGLPKLPMPDPWDSDDSWLTYCERDVAILEEAVHRLLCWHRENDLGVFKPTAAGQSMQAYRHRFMQQKILLHDEEDVKKLERSAYYAGRLSVFYRGAVSSENSLLPAEQPITFDPRAERPNGVVYKLDCNSLFPSVMRDYLYPRRLKRWRLNCPNISISYYSDMAASVACCSLVNCSTASPQRIGGKVSFCVGSFATSLPGPELSSTIAASDAATISAYAEYELADLFSDYVDYFWAMRSEAKARGSFVEADLAKLLLNALYGKFGQLTYEWQPAPDKGCPDRWSCWAELDAQTKSIQYFRSLGDLVQAKQQQGDHPQSFCAISAFVTSYARRRMDEFRRIAGYHSVYYQGVDSLFVSRQGLERLDAAGCLDQRSLGKLRIEGESHYTEFRGPGYYLFNGQWTQASIRRGARQVAIGQWEQTNFQSLETACQHPQIEGVRSKLVRRSIDPDVNAPLTTDNGWVLPLKGVPCESRPSDNASDCGCNSAIRDIAFQSTAGS